MAALTDNAIKAAKPASKVFKLTVEKGLYLLIQPAGGKWWRFDYRFDGKRKTLSMGIYPDVNLKQARAYRDEARQLVPSDGVPNFWLSSSCEQSSVSMPNRRQSPPV
jgi:hypothetical protein